MELERIWQILDCPGCQRGQGLRFQAGDYLACPVCEFWYPIREGVMVLLPPERVEGGFRRSLGPEIKPSLAPSPSTSFDMKAAVYSYFIRAEEFCERFDVRRQPLVVDVGCSTGSFSATLGAEQYYLGLDLSFRSLSFARRATGHLFAQADAQRLPLKERSVPYFVSRETLEHLTNPEAGAQELRRIGDRGVVELPTLDFPFLYDPLNYLLIRRGKRAKFGIYGYDHHALHDVAGWRDLLTKTGFRVGREAPLGTGFALNSFDNVWHLIFSWRSFDTLPRNGIPAPVLAPLFKLYAAAHKVDRAVYPRAASHGYEVC